MALFKIALYFVAALCLANTIPVDKKIDKRDASKKSALSRKYVLSLTEHGDKQASHVNGDKKSAHGNNFNSKSLK